MLEGTVLELRPRSFRILDPSVHRFDVFGDQFISLLMILLSSSTS